MSHTELSLPGQLLSRYLPRITGQNLLIFGCEDIEIIQTIVAEHTQAAITVFTFDYNLYHEFLGHLPEHIVVQYGPWYQTEQPHDQVIAYLPKSDALIDFTLQIIAQNTGPGGELMLVGEKIAGIRSQEPVIEKWFGAVSQYEYGRHSGLYFAKKSDEPKPQVALDDFWQTFSFQLPQNISVQVASLPGVFSRGRLDEGTSLLLQHMRVPAHGDILDWGCGAGVIGVVAGLLQPGSQIDFVDVNALALAATTRTCALNGLEQIEVYPSHVFSNVHKQFDLILSNPPFHSGVRTSYSASEEFITNAKNYLKPHGKLMIVANSFLRYRPILEKHFDSVQVLVDTPTYRVYSAS